MLTLIYYILVLVALCLVGMKTHLSYLSFIVLFQVKSLIVQEDFKPNCAAVTLDFLFRKGIVLPDEGKSKTS